MRPKTPLPTDHELELLRILWDRGPSTVREVYETLRERRSIAYTTVMTTLNVLVEKGHLTRQRQANAFVYSPLRSAHEVSASMVQSLIERIFDGSARSLALHLVDEQKLTPEDLDELTRRIEEKSDECD